MPLLKGRLYPKVCRNWFPSWEEMAAVEYRSLRMGNCVFEISMQQTHHGPSADIFCPQQLEGQSVPTGVRLYCWQGGCPEYLRS